MHRSLFFLISLSLAASALAAAPAKHVEITYELSRNGSTLAESIERLDHDGSTYAISAQTKGRGLFALRGDAVRTSRGAIGPQGLQPSEYEDRRSGREPVRAKFDWHAGTLTLQDKPGTTDTRPLVPGMLDRLSFQYGFAFHAPGPAPTGFSVTDGKGISTSVYVPAGNETLKTPAGEFETLKLARRKNNPDDRTSEIWLATKHAYLPVRILVVEKNGTRIDQVATRLADH